MHGILYEEASLGTFLFVTVVLGGAAGWLSGRAIATTWRPRWSLAPAALAIGIGVRFIHFALFDATFLSSQYYAIDTVFAFAVALAGYRATRQRQMARQYGFLQRTDAAAAPNHG
jgi:hypothetical protein